MRIVMNVKPSMKMMVMIWASTKNLMIRFFIYVIVTVSTFKHELEMTERIMHFS